MAELTVKMEALSRKLAAALAAKRGRNRKPPATGTRTRKKPEPEPEVTPEPEAEETVGIDAEARILQLVAEGHTASEAGRLAGVSDSYGRQVARTAKKLAEAAPEGRELNGVES